MQLARTDIADHALAALRDVEGARGRDRRPPRSRALGVHAARTDRADGERCDVVLDAADHRLVRQDLARSARTASTPSTSWRSSASSAMPLAPSDARPRIRLAYQLTPHRVLGRAARRGDRVHRTGTDEVRRIDAGLVLTSIGYRGKPVADLPFDDAAAVVPNDARPGRRSGDRRAGARRAMSPAGSSAARRASSAPTSRAPRQTVHDLVADYNAGRLADPADKPAALDKLVRSRRPDVVDAGGWKAIDAAEIARGGETRPRDKFTAVADMLSAAATAPAPPIHRRLLAGLRR